MNEQELERQAATESTPASQPITTADLARGAGQSTEKPARSQTPPESADPLFVREEAEDFRTRWQRVQTAFVDEPKQAVQQADELVAAAMKRLAEVFASERDKLEHEWDKNEDVSTEDLRLALRRYRSFFDRLLSV